MRRRSDVVSRLEAVYREAYDRASEDGRENEMAALDFRFQRDQILLEALLDVRDALGKLGAEGGGGESSLLDKAKALQRLAGLEGPRTKRLP